MMEGWLDVGFDPQANHVGSIASSMYLPTVTSVYVCWLLMSGFNHCFSYVIHF